MKHAFAIGMTLLCVSMLDPEGGFAGSWQEAKSKEVQELSLFYDEEAVVYSVSKRREQIMESPAAVYTVTADDIKYSGAKKITDVFRMVPGVDVADVNSFYTGVQSRGFSFLPKYAREMLVLIDGRTVYSPQINATFWDQIPLFLEDIDRIEIVRGPNAALYGANAFNGVINIITKDPEKTKGLFASVTAGNRESQWEMFRYGGTAGALAFRLTAGYHETDGFSSVDDHMRKPQITFRGDYSIDSTSSLKVHAGYAGGERELSGQIQPNVTSLYTMAQYEKKIGTHNRLAVQIYHDYRKSELTAGHQDKVWEEDIEVQFNRDGDRYHLVCGGGYRYDRIKNGYLSGQTYKEYQEHGTRGLHLDSKDNRIIKTFANITYRLTDQLHLTGALMVENNDFIGTMFSPKGALVFMPWEDHSFRFSVSRAYRTPSFIEEKADFSIPFPLPPFYIGQLGNEHLDPERIIAYELGYRGQFLDKRLYLNLEAFYHALDDIIAYVEDTPGIYHYKNFATNHVRGLEASLAWQVTRWWRLSMAYSYQKATDDYLKGLVIKHKFNAGSRFMLPLGFTANFQLYYVDSFHFEEEAWVPPTTVDDYVRFDVRVSKRFFNDTMEVAFIGQNLFDPRHYEYPQTLSAGEANRAFFIELSYNFGGQ